MTKSLLLRIDEPCHVKWDAMTPQDRGRFCAQCQKKVVDFSDMSDAQLLTFFKKPPAGSVCGRFTAAQLERPLQSEKKKLPWHIVLFRVLLPAFFFGRAQAQERMGKVAPVPGVTNTINSSRETVTLGMVLPFNMVPATCEGGGNDKNREHMRVRVVNDREEPLPFASLRLLRTGQVWVADAQGLLNVKHTELKANDSLECSAAGHVSQIRAFQGKDRQLDFVLPIRPELEEVVVVTSTDMRHCSIVVGGVNWVRVKDMENRKESSVENTAAHTLAFYPNPARAGSALNIRLEKPAEGYYQCRLLNLQGQLLLQREIWLDEHAGLLTLELPVVPPGTYFVEMMEKRAGKKVGGKLVVL